MNDFLVDAEHVESATTLSIIFHDIVHAVRVTDDVVNMILYPPLIDKLNDFIAALGEYHATTERIESMNRILRIFTRIQITQIDLHQDSLLETLFLSVARPMSSPFFMSQLPTTPKHMVDLQPMQTLLFDTCIEFMYWQPYEDSLVRRKGLTQICDAHLTMLVRMMSSLSFSEPVARLVSLVSLHIMVEDSKHGR